MNVLITNDDGIDAPGILAIAKTLSRDNKVWIVAPMVEQSAKSQAVTIWKDIAYEERSFPGLDAICYALDGTPADCVRIAEAVLVDEKIDMVVSGINRGLNAGMDVAYSGTVGACFEANRIGLPAFAFSTAVHDGNADYETASRECGDIFRRYSKFVMKHANLLVNVNVPNAKFTPIKGTKICRVGNHIKDVYEKGENFIKILHREHGEQPDETDRSLVEKGYVTISPISLDFNREFLLENISSWV